MRPNQFSGGEAHRVHPDRAVDGVRHLPGPQDLPRGARHPLVQRRQAGVPPEGAQVSELKNLDLSKVYVCLPHGNPALFYNLLSRS